MMTKTNKPFIRAGYRRLINLDHVQDISWTFDENGGDTQVTIIFANGSIVDLFLDDEEFSDMLGGLTHAQI